MRTSLLLFALLLTGTGFFFTGCDPEEDAPDITATSLDYIIQHEMGNQLQIILADTSANMNIGTLRTFAQRYLASVGQYEESYNYMIVSGIKPPPPPPPPCSGCIWLHRLLVQDGYDIKGLQVLDAKKEIVAGFRPVEGAERMVEPDLKEGMSLPESGFLRTPTGDGFMDIPMQFAQL